MTDDQKIKVLDWLLERRDDFIWNNVLYDNEKEGCDFLEEALLRAANCE